MLRYEQPFRVTVQLTRDEVNALRHMDYRVTSPWAQEHIDAADRAIDQARAGARATADRYREEINELGFLAYVVVSPWECADIDAAHRVVEKVKEGVCKLVIKDCPPPTIAADDADAVRRDGSDSGNGSPPR